MQKLKTYIVTERAGEWVAGRRRPASGRLMLTDRQAAYELILGTIRPLPEPEPEPKRARKRRKKKA